ncbi:hypothetical protein D7I45_01040 [Apilactobacillus bombintestini]|uniref:DNA-directed RNA polymerase beta subunit n=2 Tax=Apilactobacillus bombintestini TaxID=2419772 RepID=A0A387ANC5_9LACO|nr:hypothetical protein D7I45_01040 [Apilactobacillus bombintestini]
MLDHNINNEMVQNFFDYYYHDRGMIKWQGFMLSDHVSVIRKEKRSLVDDSFSYMNKKEIFHTLINKGKHHQVALITYLDGDGEKQSVQGNVQILEDDVVQILDDTSELKLSINKILIVE